MGSSAEGCQDQPILAAMPVQGSPTLAVIHRQMPEIFTIAEYLASAEAGLGHPYQNPTGRHGAYRRTPTHRMDRTAAGHAGGVHRDDQRRHGAAPIVQRYP